MPILTEKERLGTRLSGKYDLTAILGRGGMGTVFAGTHAWTGRKVAVKLLKPTFAEDANVVRRFLREARSASAIRHPHVVDVLDMGQEDDGTVYMVLELLEGESLGALLRRRGKLDAAELLPILLPVADALVEVHAAGLVHRDFKPDNVFVASRRGVTIPKLLDFGIAKVLEDTGGSHTRTGAIVGTPHYMSPEQASGSSEIGPASDVWSFGVVLFECLSGGLPYEADTATAVLVKILTTAPPPLLARAPEVAPELGRIVDRAMQPDTALRFLDMRSMRDALRDAARALSIAIPEEVPDEEPAPFRDDLGRLSTGEIEMPIQVESVVDRGIIESAPTQASDRPRPRPTPPSGSVVPAPSVQLAPNARRGAWLGVAAGIACVLAIGLALGRVLGSSVEGASGAPPAPEAVIVPDAAVERAAVATGVPAAPDVAAEPEVGAAPGTEPETAPTAEVASAPETGREAAGERRTSSRRGAAAHEGQAAHGAQEGAPVPPPVVDTAPAAHEDPDRRVGVRTEW